MSDQEPPKIEFPCANYPIKIMGEAGEEFREYVLAAVKKHAPDFDPASATYTPSRNGRYESVGVMITATGKAQLEAIFAELKKHPSVRMVL